MKHTSSYFFPFVSPLKKIYFLSIYQSSIYLSITYPSIMYHLSIINPYIYPSIHSSIHPSIHFQNPLLITFLTALLGQTTTMLLNTCKRGLYFCKQHPTVHSPHHSRRAPVSPKERPKSLNSLQGPVRPGPTHDFLRLLRPHLLPPQGPRAQSQPVPLLPSLSLVRPAKTPVDPRPTPSSACLFPPHLPGQILLTTCPRTAGIEGSVAPEAAGALGRELGDGGQR